MFFKSLGEITHFHFVGIGGISMSSLAKFVFSCGMTVKGSDICTSDELLALEKIGITIFIGHKAENIGNAQAVIYTDAVSENNKEVEYAKEKGLFVCSRGEFLNIVREEFKETIAIAGSHGKTTCTAMCAHILKKSAKRFSVHLGGEDINLGNYYSTGKDIFVTEACEYKKNIHYLKNITVATILNCDKDHMECYNGFEDLQNTFYQFGINAKNCVLNADDKNLLPIEGAILFSEKNKNCQYYAANFIGRREKYAFTVYEFGRILGRIRLHTVGRCQVSNALAAVATMRTMGIDFKSIVAGLEEFYAVRRRFEKIGKYKGADFICDYAHHPKQIESTLRTAKKMTKGKLFVIFQPHTYSRTRLLMDDFVQSLSSLKNLIIYKTYPAREEYDEQGSAKRLSENIKNSLYTESARELENYFHCSIEKGDIVLFLGAGDIYYTAKTVLSHLLEEN